MRQDIPKILNQKSINPDNYDMEKLYKAGMDNIINSIDYYYDKPFPCSSVLPQLFETGILEYITVEDINRKLKSVVEEKTKEISNEKKALERQRDSIEKQHSELSHKNEEIVQSITYAKGLQNAFLPSNLDIKRHLNSFLFYQPKDIVAGDFYWFEMIKDKGKYFLYFAVADCTGHGVPGAMVSVVCANALNRSLMELNITDPGKILDKTRHLVIESFSKNENIKDGMDISLCRFDISNNELLWAGANNPLWILRRETMEIEEIKADKQPVGNYPSLLPFTTKKVKIEKNDIIYLFSDGYADQFGGLLEKKFKVGAMKRLFIENALNPMDEQMLSISSTFNDWKGRLEQTDDVTVWGIKLYE
jgi:serine phosphatase RsbU (regulator of sigma subunit)